MTLRDQLLIKHSKSNIEQVYRQVLYQSNLLEELMILFLFDEYHVVQRAAWVVGLLGERNPEKVTKYLPQMMRRCSDPKVPDAVKRNVSRCLHFMDIPTTHHEAAVHLCFELLANPNEATAVRCWSMSVLAKLCASSFPELNTELMMLLDDALQHQELSVGFRSKAQKVMTEIKKKKDTIR